MRRTGGSVVLVDVRAHRDRESGGPSPRATSRRDDGRGRPAVARASDRADALPLSGVARCPSRVTGRTGGRADGRRRGSTMEYPGRRRRPRPDRSTPQPPGGQRDQTQPVRPEPPCGRAPVRSSRSTGSSPVSRRTGSRRTEQPRQYGQQPDQPPVRPAAVRAAAVRPARSTGSSTGQPPVRPAARTAEPPYGQPPTEQQEHADRAGGGRGRRPRRGRRRPFFLLRGSDAGTVAPATTSAALPRARPSRPHRRSPRGLGLDLEPSERPSPSDGERDADGERLASRPATRDARRPRATTRSSTSYAAGLLRRRHGGLRRPVRASRRGLALRALRRHLRRASGRRRGRHGLLHGRLPADS